jgi:acyl-coenzyme A synthetase/AMP-(fatty) acid ligase
LKRNFEEYYKKISIGPDNPDEEFIISGQTFKEIYELAAGIADHCVSNGIHSLCLCTENKALITAALLASAVGGAVVILPYSFNKILIKEIKATVGFDVIFSDTFEKIFAEYKVVAPDKIGKKSKNILCPRDPDSVFCKIFTGGSTGKPKIWQKTPRNLFSEALYHSNAFNVTKNDVFVSSVPAQHIYGLLYSVLVPFVSSARVSGETCTYPQEILSSIKNNSASVLVSIPMHYRVLKSGSFNLPSLRLALSSGGSLDYADAEYFYKQTGVEIAEIFGSTETGGIASRYNSGKEKAWSPFNNIEWKILNERLSVRSDFISPDLPRDDGGYYLTEDRIEITGDKCFTHLGRADGIVKVAGKRVDLKEIENKIKQIKGVEDAVIISVPSAGGRKNEISAVIKGSIKKSTVRRSAKELLEPYELPRKIKVIEKIPVTSTGKYDRQKIMSIIKSP